MAPRPLHPTVRGRSGKAPRMTNLVSVAELDRATIEVPELPSDRIWDPRTSQWWVDCWQSPMRLEWDAADTHAILQTAYLLDEFWRIVGRDEVDYGDLTKVSKAIQDRCARLGLDPFARRSLGWLLVQTERDEAQRDLTKARTVTERAKAVPKRRGGLKSLE